MNKIVIISVYGLLAVWMIYLAFTAEWWLTKTFASLIAAWDIYEIIKHVKRGR